MVGFSAIMSRMNIRFLKPEDVEALNALVAAHPYGSVEQSWEWGVLQTTIPGRDAFFVFGVFDGNSLVGSMLLIRQHMGMGKTWLWSPRGPLLPAKEAGIAWELLRESCLELAMKDGDVFMRIEPGAKNDDEFPVDGYVGKESYMPQNTLRLNLGVNLDSIREQMTQKGRYNLKKASKAGVYVQRSEGVYLDEFFEILGETAMRDGFHVHDIGFYKRFFEILEDKALLYVAHLEKDFVGAILVTHFGNTATYYFGASADAHRKSRAAYALQWFAIQAAKDAGMKYYDFLGIAPEGVDKHVLSGVTQFKTRFGGQRIAYQRPRELVYRRGWWLLRKLLKYVRALRP